MRPLAQERLDDYQLFTEWEKTRDATKDPEVALKKIRGARPETEDERRARFPLADEEARLAAQGRELSARRAAEEEKRAAEDKKRAATEAPRWQAALAAERKLLAAYQFENAVADPGIDQARGEIAPGASATRNCSGRNGWRNGKQN